MPKDDARITTKPTTTICDCCDKLKSCHLYSLFIGAKWVCASCRKGVK